MIERMARNRRVVAAATIAGLLVLGPRAANADERGECYRARIPAPIVLPDGSVHPAGELRICMTRRLSPVEWLHATYIGGEPIGAFRGHDSRIERGTEPVPPEFVFLREADGSFRLFGFRTSGRAGARLHRLVPGETLAAVSTAESNPPSDPHSGLITLAATRR